MQTFNKRIWLGMVMLWLGGFGMGWLVHKLASEPKSSSSLDIKEMFWSDKPFTPEEIIELYKQGPVQSSVTDSAGNEYIQTAYDFGSNGVTLSFSSTNKIGTTIIKYHHLKD